MLAPLSLLFVGAVLCLNGIWMSGRIADREIVIINLIVAAITSGVAIFSALTAVDVLGVKSAALTLLFSTTYMWFAFNRMTGTDGRGLGWFSLLVAITVTPEAIVQITNANSVISLWLGLSWGVWAVLWFMFFVLLTLQKPVAKQTTVITLFAGIATAWLPAMLILYGVLA
ncbi:AmiS/UreI family transporter [Yoonia sp. MH D7]